VWIFLPDCFVSIVEHRSDPGRVIVRARRAGDVARFLAHAGLRESVRRTPSADYGERACISRNRLATALSLMAIDGIRYHNFKAACDPSDRDRDHVHHRVYAETLALTENRKTRKRCPGLQAPRKPTNHEEEP